MELGDGGGVWGEREITRVKGQCLEALQGGGERISGGEWREGEVMDGGRKD